MENVESIIEETEKKAPFYSYRSVGQCLSAGISFFTDNFLFMLKVSFPVLVISGALISVYFSSVSPSGPSLIGSLASLGSMFMEFVIIGMVMRLILQESMGKGFLGYNSWTLFRASLGQIKRCTIIYITLFVVFMLLMAPTICAFFPLMNMGTPVVFAVVALLNLILVIFLFEVPANMALYYGVLENGSLWKNVWNGFKKGYKYWGRIFGLELIMFAVVAFICFCFALPAGVFAIAKNSMLQVQAMGDKVDDLDVINCWFMFVSFLSGFLCMFVHLVNVPVFGYLYATIKVSEEESVSLKKIDELA